MFKLVIIEETIQVPAKLFGIERLAALEHMVNKKFSDSVIPGVGLCVALWDWVSIGEDRLVMQSGQSSTVCIFRMVVFAPFEGEVVFSRINASNECGLFVEMGFFDSIHIPKAKLPVPTDWDREEKVWIWRPEFGEGETGDGATAQALYMDVSNECVFRVVESQYEDWSSVPPSEREVEKESSAMSLIGSLFDSVVEDNQGLGDPLWWYEDEEEAVNGDDEIEEGGDVEQVNGEEEGYDMKDDYEQADEEGYVEEDELVDERFDGGDVVGAEDDN